jgi:hypothetical protein
LEYDEFFLREFFMAKDISDHPYGRDCSSIDFSEACFMFKGRGLRWEVLNSQSFPVTDWYPEFDCLTRGLA